jgi:fluoride ion exporter CrcB/FEX
MRQFILVALGGFIGTALRYGVSGVIARTRAGAVFPFAPSSTVSEVICFQDSDLLLR